MHTALRVEQLWSPLQGKRFGATLRLLESWPGLGPLVVFFSTSLSMPLRSSTFLSPPPLHLSHLFSLKLKKIPPWMQPILSSQLKNTGREFLTLPTAPVTLCTPISATSPLLLGEKERGSKPAPPLHSTAVGKWAARSCTVDLKLKISCLYKRVAKNLGNERAQEGKKDAGWTVWEKSVFVYEKRRKKRRKKNDQRWFALFSLFHDPVIAHRRSLWAS